MTEMSSIAALSAGLATSIHCVGMCGPLACSVTSRSKSRDHALLETTAYHLGRVVSYTFIGMMAGMIGKQPLSFFFDSPAVILPWLMIPFLIVSAFPKLVKLPRLKFLTMPYYKAKMWSQNKPAGIAGGLLGLISPCLPCTPLYLIFGVSLLSGSALMGAKVALCFSLGTIPLLWAAQSSSRMLTKWIPVSWRNPLRSAFLIAVTIILALRLKDTIPTTTETAQGPRSEQVAPTTAEQTIESLPSCCGGK